MAIRGLALLSLIVAILASSAAATGINGCGGFVEASPTLIKSRTASDGKLDYSDVTVELCTVDGLVKDSTQCAPNGYYFIPVYDKGSFVLRVKGPNGWSLEPEKVPVVINHDGCNANEDINFRFTGFAISGKVIGAVGGNSCPLKDAGPSGVRVELLSPTDEIVAFTTTSATGIYSFRNVIPGKYKLQASHPDLGIEVRGSSEVTLGFGNMVVDDVFFAAGYDLHGFVVAQGNPILGVHVFLYSDDVSEVHCPQGVGNAPRQKGALCHAVSDADGKFTFKKLPCGVYELLPFYKGENTVFDVSPPSMVVSVEHHHVSIPQKFLVTGFSIGGRVVDDYGAGVDNANIIVDGQLRTSTDNQGYYKLDQVTSKHYSIIAEKAHYKFTKLENFLVLPNMAYIDDIKPVSFDVCGVVQMVTNSKAMITITHGPENVKPQKALVDEHGSFCFEVPSGEYRVSAFAVEAENSGLVFSPSFIDVKVKNPLLNVQFFQAQVNVHGNIFCKEKCSPNISVSLVRLVGRTVQETKTATSNHESCDFVFSKVFPGNYRLEVKHSSPELPEEDNWCWEKNAIDLNVGTEDLSGIVFVQKGYWVNIISTHEADAYILQPDSSRIDLLIKKGLQKICMESPGQHELHFVNSCVSFGSSSLAFDPTNPTPIYLTGSKYLLKGEIHIDLSMIQDAVGLADHIVVDKLNKDGSSDTVATSFLSTFSHSGNEGIAIYEYSIWSDLGQEFTFAPRDTSTSQQKRILFYPKQQQVLVNVDGCQASIPPIIGRAGLYIEGSVSPAVDGVNIRIIATTNGSYIPLKEGDLAFETETGEDGLFTAGPLYDDISYKVEASKPGYHLKQAGSTSFTCQKLSEIVVRISDEKEDGGMFPSVLLSLSGENGYRNNSVSSAGGIFTFTELFPGSFYLRPLLKEYSFSPAAVAIELESGESKTVTFLANRVAYSAMGSVTLLTGQPKGGVIVEARSETKGYYEEATTDTLGNFRLRGLIPGTTYLIKVAIKEDYSTKSLERASPESLSVTVGSEDIQGLAFVVFEQPDNTILSGHVEGDDLVALQPHLSVEIRLASDPSKIELVIPLPLSFYFEVRDLPRVKHLVQLRSGLMSHSQRFQSEMLEVDLEKQPNIHAGPLKYKILEDHHKQEVAPTPIFPLIVGLSVIALFISMPRLKDLYQVVVGMSSLATPGTSSKKEVRKPVLKRRVN